ncbi:MAG TPA: hypothetical protein VOB72_12330 [Candidatus Dormibacteraeota bacterium]|nr:hypothetical protein [Candidatus Dormibacteraeota bacterium]
MRTVTVTSDRFVELGRLQARALGRPDLRLAVIPHPLAGRAPADAVTLGRAAGGEVLRVLGLSQ